MCKVYTDVDGTSIKKLFNVRPTLRKIIYSLKLVDYLHVQADNQWYSYYFNWAFGFVPTYVSDQKIEK